MNSDTGVKSSALAVLLVLGHLLHSVCADFQQRYQYYNNHDDQPPENADYYYNSYDAGNDNEPPDYTYHLPATIACFSCTLVQRDGHIQGMENCGDPFIRLDIPSVNCKGPCGKLYHQHGEKDFVITRGCLPNCKEHRDDRSYTQCCTKPYCNKSYTIHHQQYNMMLCTVTAALTLWLVGR